MRKHAYLIMAHTDVLLLNLLLKSLDDSRNDIFLHISKKSLMSQKDLYHPINANMFLVPQMNVNWGGDSQIKCELHLLECAAANDTYQYYHLLSGQDLPLKSQNQIHDFFDANDGKNYIGIDLPEYTDKFIKERICEYHIFQNSIGRNSGIFPALCYRLEKISLLIQKKLKINRTANAGKIFYKGDNWFSITHEMVMTILNEKKFIRKCCYKSLCADEIFLQTIAMNSDLKDSVVQNSLRHTDWERGNPYIFTIQDYALLSESSNLFARKFNSEVDKDIAYKIMDMIK